MMHSNYFPTCPLFPLPPPSTPFLPPNPFLTFMSSCLISSPTDFNQGCLLELGRLINRYRTEDNDFSSPLIYQWSRGGDAPIHNWWLTGTTLCRPRAYMHSCWAGVAVMATSYPEMAFHSPSPCLLVLRSFHSFIYGIHSLSLREALNCKELCKCKILLVCSLWKQNKKQTNKKLELDTWGIIYLFEVSDS